MPSIVFAVNEYSYVIHTPGDPDYLVFDGQLLKVRGVINCVGDGHHAYVIALADESPLPANRYDPIENDVWIFSRSDQFLWHIDMLRNDKPIYCFGNADPVTGLGSCVLSTSSEPVGLGEA
jgi:hypothetical protein